MTERFDRLNDRLGFVLSVENGERMGSGLLTATPEVLVLEYLPDELDEQPRRLMAMPPRTIPKRLLFMDRHGVVGLDGCRIQRASRKGGLPSWVEIHADHAIEIKDSYRDFTM